MRRLTFTIMRRAEIPFCVCSIFHLEHKGTTAYWKGWIEAICKIKLAAVFTAPFSSHTYLLLLLILGNLLGFVFCVQRGQGRFKDLLFIVSVSPITGIILDWCWAGKWGTCHLPTNYKQKYVTNNTHKMFIQHLTEHVMRIRDLIFLTSASKIL
jgi:hypothetical protein